MALAMAAGQPGPGGRGGRETIRTDSAQRLLLLAPTAPAEAHTTEVRSGKLAKDGWPNSHAPAGSGGEGRPKGTGSRAGGRDWSPCRRHCRVTTILAGCKCALGGPLGGRGAVARCQQSGPREPSPEPALVAPMGESVGAHPPPRSAKLLPACEGICLSWTCPESWCALCRC